MIGLSLSFSLVAAQEICVIYQETMRLNIKNASAATAALIKEQSTKKKRLYINQSESLYKEQPQEDQELSAQESSNVRYIQLGGLSSSVYVNRATNQRISQAYILDKKFLITETPVAQQWTIEKDEKEILGYKCKKATDPVGTVAWFAVDLPVSIGPFLYFGLPGLILEVEQKPLTFVATEIDLQCGTAKEIQPPTSGKKVTREEFNALSKKKNEELVNTSAGENTEIEVIEL